MRGHIARSPDRLILSAAMWARDHGEDISRELWEEVHRIAHQARRENVRLRACAFLATCLDLVPKPHESDPGPVSVHIAIVEPGGPRAEPSENGGPIRIIGLPGDGE